MDTQIFSPNGPPSTSVRSFSEALLRAMISAAHEKHAHPIPSPDVAQGTDTDWNARLTPVRHRLAVIIGSTADENILRPLVRLLNRPVNLLSTSGVDDDYPDHVTAVVYTHTSDRHANCPFLETEYPDLFRSLNTYTALLEALRPDGLLLLWDGSMPPALWVSAAARSGVPVVAWMRTGSPAPAELSALARVLPPTTDLASLQCTVREHLPVAYLRQTAEPRLHIGCGTCLAEGWLNVDACPLPGADYMDAEAPFPFPDNAFDYIFSEHLFEHLSYTGGRHMLAEAYRVLKPGGILRLTMPCLEFLHALLAEPDRPEHRRYIAWSTASFAPDVAADFPPGHIPAMFVVNHFMRLWGHRMIYDRPTLSAMLHRQGFCSLCYPPLGQSAHPRLVGMERHGEVIPAWANALESMTIEATKPLTDNASGHEAK